MHNLQRAYREVEDVNADFHSLRTVLRPTINQYKWNFVMFPNDGAMSHLPLIGELIIPPTYPTDPPVLHLFTRTYRWNVDIFHDANQYCDTQSTMCFDMLRSKPNGGTWEPRYTISCLFASLMQALVTPRVPQDYGPDRHEFVSMEKLENIKREVHSTYIQNKARIPHLPVVPTVSATSISAKPFRFTHVKGREPTRRLHFSGHDIYVSQAIFLQNARPAAWSTVLDLNNLPANVVFSVILSNRAGTDLFGNENDTILLRNGVTGTAAKKTANNKLVWFYHGKPLNDGHLSVCVTVTQDQFTMSYQADGTARDTFIVHGDTPISKLGKAQIGDVDGMPFYLNILFKRKSGRDGYINVLDQRGRGYIHGVPPPTPQPLSFDSPVFVKLALTAEQTIHLQTLLDFYEIGKDFEVQRSVKTPAHLTLVHQNDMSKSHFTDMLRDIYAPLRDQLIEFSVKAIVADSNCVAFLTCLPVSVNGIQVPCHPVDKIPHITMRLRKRIQPVYSNILARRVTQNRDNGLSGDTYIELPQSIKLQCPLRFHYN
jgi:ubiquitin-protein ligase